MPWQLKCRAIFKCDIKNVFEKAEAAILVIITQMIGIPFYTVDSHKQQLNQQPTRTTTAVIYDIQNRDIIICQSHAAQAPQYMTYRCLEHSKQAVAFIFAQFINQQPSNETLVVVQHNISISNININYNLKQTAILSFERNNQSHFLPLQLALLVCWENSLHYLFVTVTGPDISSNISNLACKFFIPL